MTEIRYAISALLLLAGLFFMVVSVRGVIKFPDFFSRLHAIGLGQSLGIGFCCIGLFFYQGPDITGIKIFIVLVVSMLPCQITSRTTHRWVCFPRTLL